MKNKMKKILIFAVISASFVAGYLHNRQTSTEMSSLLLENVEALATPESSGAICMGSGSVDCPEYHTKVEYYVLPYSLLH